MNSNISAVHYYDNEIFARENDLLFNKIWHFVGFRFDFENENDFVTLKISGTPIVIQNVRGTIKAFLNVCSHRFSIIQQDKSGNRPLMCPYHGWAYDKDGIPSGIPKKPLFKKFSKEELCEMKLKEFKVSFCGNLCFVSLNETIEPLEEFIGIFYDELKKMSLALGDRIDINAMEITANWKVVVENTLESYHVGLIHAETLAKLEPSGLDFEFDKNNSSWTSSLNIVKDKGGYKKINTYFSPRSYDIEGYKHILIFPNLLISSTHGISFNYSVIEPITSNVSKFTSHVFTTTKNSPDAKSVLIKAFEESLINFNRQVFDEDKAVCQLVQQGVKHTNQLGKLSDEEERVHHFQNTYIKLLENES
ncbi:aromatic ring-hydroxylating dioxygenase subunit alpha [Flavobacterium sp. ALJ2]|uniref:aromatic ring-hydroxylating oxygenase subunit alpha n=1 Tax=Flavobacterium sp. ALJ2 TaxID=2786960 RepID=UPI0018A0083F|nr:aromatic ring-hydroxylating dioxygenase subunit alpha [Flavobacterium sp. ALJ2]MBF7093123.1 aromatic ring-hydroxylating dioxygenase subunit alpha [Flavobacterium sp. ALJ2]